MLKVLIGTSYVLGPSGFVSQKGSFWKGVLGKPLLTLEGHSPKKIGRRQESQSVTGKRGFFKRLKKSSHAIVTESFPGSTVLNNKSKKLNRQSYLPLGRFGMVLGVIWGIMPGS